MNGPILNRVQSRAVDRIAIEEYGMSGLVLMENAGRGVVEKLFELDQNLNGPVFIVCGKGNNAGDGFVIARHLANHGVEVHTVCLYLPETYLPDARANYRILAAAGSEIIACHQPGAIEKLASRLANAEWIIDGMLGTGATGTPRTPVREAIDIINAAISNPSANTRLLALDIPSGLDCDTGLAAEPTCQADHTCTFATAKPGLIAEPAAAYVGELHIIDIGVPRCVIERAAKVAAVDKI